MAASVILIEATPRRADDGFPMVVRLAGGGATSPYFYGGVHWRAGVASLPSGTSSLDFDGEQLGGGGVSQAMEIQWAPATNAALSALSAFYWTDAPITVRIGPEGDAMPAVDTIGLVLDSRIENGVLKIALADSTVDLKRPLLVDRFAGTGGIEGPVEWEGLIKSRAFGKCFNLIGRIIDPARNIICFGDPGRRWRAFLSVRDKGVAASVETLTLLDWQGDVASTFAALQASVPVAGGGVLCPSIASIKWWTVPAGDLHADVEGEVEGGYVETAPEIVARIVAARSTIALGEGELAVAAAARPASYGYVISDDSTTAAAAISTILGDVSLSWMIVGGSLVFRRWEWSAPVRQALSNSVTRREVQKPVGTRKIGYRRNWSPMARSDLGASVLAQDVVFDTGETLDLLPARIDTIEQSVIINAAAQVTATANAELKRIRDRALLFPGPEGEDTYTLIKRGDLARVEGDAANAEMIELLGAVNSTGSAFILGDRAVLATPTGAGGTIYQSVAATFGAQAAAIDAQGAAVDAQGGAIAEHSGQIETIQQVFVDADGAIARAVLRVAADGRIIGFAATNDGTLGDMVFTTDVFRIETPEGVKLFYADAEDGGRVKMPNVLVDTIKVNSVGVDQMQLGAAQKAAWTTLGSDFPIPRGQTLAVFSLAFVKEDSDSAIEIMTFLNASSPDDLQFDATLEIDGMVMQATPGVNLILDNQSSQARMPITPMTIASAIAAGEHTISVKIYNREVDNVTLTIQAGSFLKVTELRKASIGGSTGDGGALPPPVGVGGPYGGGGGGYSGGQIP